MSETFSRHIFYVGYKKFFVGRFQFFVGHFRPIHRSFSLLIKRKIEKHHILFAPFSLSLRAEYIKLRQII